MRQAARTSVLSVMRNKIVSEQDYVKLIGVEGARLLREYGTGEIPQAQSAEEAHRNARGKRAPGAEINFH